MFVHGLPYLHALCFCIASERLFTQLTCPVLWGKAGADFITNASRIAMSAEILVMDRVGKGKLGMIAIFCRSDQVRVEHTLHLSPVGLTQARYSSGEGLH